MAETVKKTEGLVLREVNYKDADKLLTVLTRDMGKITIQARGVKRKGSKLVSACQLLAFSEFSLFSYRGRHMANEAQSIEIFAGLRTELELLSLSMYFADIVEALSDEDVQNAEILALILNSLHMLCKKTRPPTLIKAAFELKLMSFSGYEPSVYECAICGNKAPAEPFFNIQKGMLCCADCKGKSGGGVEMPLCRGALDAMRHIVYGEAARIFSFTLNGDSLRRLCSVSEAYIHAQLERGFKTLDFYKTVMLPDTLNAVCYEKQTPDGGQRKYE